VARLFVAVLFITEQRQYLLHELLSCLTFPPDSYSNKITPERAMQLM